MTRLECLNLVKCRVPQFAEGKSEGDKQCSGAIEATAKCSSE